MTDRMQEIKYPTREGCYPCEFFQTKEDCLCEFCQTKEDCLCEFCRTSEGCYHDLCAGREGKGYVSVKLMCLWIAILTEITSILWFRIHLSLGISQAKQSSPCKAFTDEGKITEMMRGEESDVCVLLVRYALVCNFGWTDCWHEFQIHLFVKNAWHSFVSPPSEKWSANKSMKFKKSATAASLGFGFTNSRSQSSMRNSNNLFFVTDLLVFLFKFFTLE